MPGYGIVYYFLRFLANQPIALNIIIFLQFLFSAISVYFIAITAKNIFNVKNIFYICFYLYLINTFASKFDFYSQPESFTCSATIFSVYFFVKFIKNFKSSDILFSGLFLCWLIFLKPVYLPLFSVFVIILFNYFMKKYYSFLHLLKYTVLLIFPFIIFETLWIYRNYNKYNEIIPLQTSINTDDTKNTYLIYLGEFIGAWGGDGVMCNPTSVSHWFFLYTGRNSIIKHTDNIKLPSYIYTSKFNKDSLIKIKNYISIYQDR